MTLDFDKTSLSYAAKKKLKSESTTKSDSDKELEL